MGRCTGTVRTGGPGYTDVLEEGCAKSRRQRQNQARRSLKQELKANRTEHQRAGHVTGRKCWGTTRVIYLLASIFPRHTVGSSSPTITSPHLLEDQLLPRPSSRATSSSNKGAQGCWQPLRKLSHSSSCPHGGLSPSRHCNSCHC